MTETAATESGEAQTDAKSERKPPKGYVAESFRVATFDATRFGLGVLTLDEPTQGRVAAWNRAQAEDPAKSAPLLLRAIVRRFSVAGQPKPDDSADAWVAWYDALPFGAARVLRAVADHYADALVRGIDAEGNG